jgi:vancomycin permeability regulator SanA
LFPSKRHALERKGPQLQSPLVLQLTLGQVSYFMDRFFKLILQLIGALAVIFLFTAVMICLDGAVDLGEKSDAALVLGRPHALHDGADPVLDKVIKLYNNGDFTLIIVSASTSHRANDQPAALAKYLESHGIDSGVIVEGHGGGDVPATARETVKIMKARQLQSVMIIADYYRITRMKLALSHEGISAIDKAHLGKIQSEDAADIAREVVTLYDYVARTFVFPMAEKVKDEAQVELNKAKTDAGKAKQKVDKGLDSLPR